MALITIKPEDTALRETVQYITDNVDERRRITPQLIDDICAAIEKGADYEIAALSCGIHWNTLMQWLTEGAKLLSQRSTNLMAVLARRVAEVASRREVRSIVRIDDAGQGGALLYERTITKPDGTVTHEKKFTAPNPTADMWFLERKYPQRWGKLDTLKATIDHTVHTLTDADLDTKISEIIGKVLPERSTAGEYHAENSDSDIIDVVGNEVNVVGNEISHD